MTAKNQRSTKKSEVDFSVDLAMFDEIPTRFDFTPHEPTTPAPQTNCHMNRPRGHRAGVLFVDGWCGFRGVPFGFAHPILLAALSRPATYFVAAFLLIFKTQWCENQFKLITLRAIHSQDST